jgi:hypothetical protein
MTKNIGKNIITFLKNVGTEEIVVQHFWKILQNFAKFNKK